MVKLTQDRVLGLIVLALGLFIALYWAQADSETGLFEKLRGRSAVGDALAPTVAGTLLALAGAWLVLTGGGERTISWRNAAYLASLGGCLLLSIMLMRWAGPCLTEALTGQEYRPQRDTAPWKYLGYLMGGTTMIASLIFLAERRFSWSRLAIALGVTVALILFYDLPFEDLLLPPNGDV